MRKNNEKEWEDRVENVGAFTVFRQYATLIAPKPETYLPYDEDRDQWTLQTGKRAVPTTSLLQTRRIVTARRVETVEIKPTRRFWPRFFGQKA